MKLKFLLTSGRLEYRRVISKNKHKVPEKEIQKYVYFPREFDFAYNGCRDYFSMEFLKVLVSETGQEHKISWILHQ